MMTTISGIRPQSISFPYRRHRGFTLVEVMMSMILVAISAALAIPSYQDMVEKRQLTNAAERLATFVNATQSIAIRSNQVVTVSFGRVGHDNWCIGATLGEVACDCKETLPAESDYCEIDSQPYLLTQDMSEGPELMHSINSNGAYSFDPVRGLFTDMDDFLTMEMHTKSRDYKIDLQVTPTGRVLLCSHDSGHEVPGYDVCPAAPQVTP